MIGAIYLDGGLEPARRFVVDHWRDRMLDLRRLASDAKTALQEWAQGWGSGPPTYAMVDRARPRPRADVSRSASTVDRTEPGRSAKAARGATPSRPPRRPSSSGEGVWKDEA